MEDPEDPYTDPYYTCSGNYLKRGTTGNSEVKISEEIVLELYPNPTLGEVRIDARFNEDPFSISILNQVGDVVWTGESKGNSPLDVDLSNQTSGVYIVQAVSSKGVKTRKLIIE